MAHAAVVDDVHAVVPHEPAAVTDAVAVELVPPKLRPLIVRTPTVVSPALAGAKAETNGAAHVLYVATLDCALDRDTVTGCAVCGYRPYSARALSTIKRERDRAR